MGNIVDITENQPHLVSEVICVKCFKRWIDVRPADLWLKDLECPNCGMSHTIIETGQILEDEDYDQL